MKYPTWKLGLVVVHDRCYWCRNEHCFRKLHSKLLSILSEPVVQRCSVKKVLLEISQNSQENSCARDSFLTKLQALGLQLYFKKETLAQVLTCEFCEISRDTFFHRTPLVAASVLFCILSFSFSSFSPAFVFFIFQLQNFNKFCYAKPIISQPFLINKKNWI